MIVIYVLPDLGELLATTWCYSLLEYVILAYFSNTGKGIDML